MYVATPETGRLVLRIGYDWCHDDHVSDRTPVRARSDKAEGANQLPDVLLGNTRALLEPPAGTKCPNAPTTCCVGLRPEQLERRV